MSAIEVPPVASTGDPKACKEAECKQHSKVRGQSGQDLEDDEYEEGSHINRIPADDGDLGHGHPQHLELL
jgi:hypothetical protein